MSERNLETVLAQMADLPEFVEIPGLGPITRGNFHSYPIHIAAIWGDLEAGQILLAAGADLNARGEHGYTPLHEAVQQGHSAFVQWLMANGVFQNLKNDDGQTPLDLAIIMKEKKLADLLQTAPDSAC